MGERGINRSVFDANSSSSSYLFFRGPDVPEAFVDLNAAIANKRAFIEELGACVRNLENAIEALVQDIQFKEGLWEVECKELAESKKTIDGVIDQMRKVSATVSKTSDLKSYLSYSKSVQALHNHFARYLQLLAKNEEAKQRYHGKDGKSDYLLDMHEQLKERKKDLDREQQRLQVAQQELRVLERRAAGLQRVDHHDGDLAAPFQLV